MLPHYDSGNTLIQFVDIDHFARIGLLDIRRHGYIVIVLGNLAVLDQTGKMIVVRASHESRQYTLDIRVRQLVLISLVDKFIGCVDKERRIVLLALFQNDNTSGDTDPEKEIGRELDYRVDIVVINQIFPCRSWLTTKACAS